MNNSVLEEQEVTTDTIVEEIAPQESPNVTLEMNGTLAVAPVLTKPKAQRGRPNVHPFAGRIYLIKKELEAAMADKEAFVSLMQETYCLSDERKEELGAVLDAPNEMYFTFHGEIIQVLNELHRLRALYGEKARVSISKERLLSPSNKFYAAPVREVIGERKGKSVYKHLFEEFSPTKIYGYVVVTL